MSAKLKQLEDILRPVVEAGDAYNIYTIVGLWDPNRALVIAPLKPWEERSRSQQEITASIRGDLNALPGVQAYVWQPNSLGLRGGTGEGLEFALTGTSYRTLAENARVMQQEIEAKFSPDVWEAIRPFWSTNLYPPGKQNCLRIIERCMDAIKNRADHLLREMDIYRR